MIRPLQGDRRRERFGVVIPAVQARSYLARALAERGDFRNGASQGQEAVQLAEELDHPFSLSWACLGLAYVKSAQGELGEAAQLLERATAECRRWKIGVQAPLVAALLGHVYARFGRIAEGVTLLQQAVSDYKSASMEHFLSISVVHLGEAYLRADQIDNARECAERARLIATRRGERGFEAWALGLLGDVAARQEGAEGTAALGYYREAIAQASPLGMRPLVAHCNLKLSQHLTRIGQVGLAEEHRSAASAIYRTIDMSIAVHEAEN